MSELMAALEFVRKYLDDILIISKDSSDDHLNKLKMVFTKLRDVGWRINADKSEFCAEETEYMGYTYKKRYKKQPYLH